MATSDAVSVLKTLFPNKSGLNPASVDSLISSSVKPPSGPIKIVALDECFNLARPEVAR